MTVESNFEPVRLSQNNGPELEFEGREIGFYTTQNREETKSRWQELTLWETPKGNWIAQLTGCSNSGSERDIVSAAVVPTGADEDGRRDAVMAFFGWSTAAKALARSMGWKMVRRVE